MNRHRRQVSKDVEMRPHTPKTGEAVGEVVYQAPFPAPSEASVYFIPHVPKAPPSWGSKFLFPTQLRVLLFLVALKAVAQDKDRRGSEPGL